MLVGTKKYGKRDFEGNSTFEDKERRELRYIAYILGSCRRCSTIKPHTDMCSTTAFVSDFLPPISGLIKYRSQSSTLPVLLQYTNYTYVHRTAGWGGRKRRALTWGSLWRGDFYVNAAMDFSEGLCEGRKIEDISKVLNSNWEIGSLQAIN